MLPICHPSDALSWLYKQTSEAAIWYESKKHLYIVCYLREEEPVLVVNNQGNYASFLLNLICQYNNCLKEAVAVYICKGDRFKLLSRKPENLWTVEL